MRRPILRTGQKFYRSAIEIYLTEKIVEKIEAALETSHINLKDAFAACDDAVYSAEWVDIGGQLMPQKRLTDLEDQIECGRIDSIDSIAAELKKIDQAYSTDEWLWVRNTYKQIYDVDLDNISKDDLSDIIQTFFKAKSKFFRLVSADAEKEFNELSQCGLGQDGNEKSVAEDFCQVRGTYEENKFVKDMKIEIGGLQQRIQCLEKKLSSL